MRRGAKVGLLLILTGLSLFLISSIPVTRTDEAISTSFTLSPGSKYGPYDEGTYYHTRVLTKSMLEGEIKVEGDGIRLTASGYNAQHISDVYVRGRYSFTISPADDQYTFTFDNTGGEAESTVMFSLTETWTSSHSPLVWILGLMGFLLLVPLGLATLALTHHRKMLTKNSRARA
jgi:hypothetical protein